MIRIFKHIAAAMTVAVFSLSMAAQVKTDGKSTDIDGVVRFDKTIHDFGDVTLGQGALNCAFTVTNISDKPIVIYNVVSSCGCTDVKWTREPVLPGKSGKISATYSNDEGPYPFDKTLTVYISNVKKPIVLRLRGIAHEKKLALSELYPVHKGSLALRKTEIKLGNLSQNGQKSDAMNVANIGTDKSIILQCFRRAVDFRFAEPDTGRTDCQNDIHRNGGQEQMGKELVQCHPGSERTDIQADKHLGIYQGRLLVNECQGTRKRAAACIHVEFIQLRQCKERLHGKGYIHIQQSRRPPVPYI